MDAILGLLSLGIKGGDIGVITPFRNQVSALTKNLDQIIKHNDCSKDAIKGIYVYVYVLWFIVSIGWGYG